MFCCRSTAVNLRQHKLREILPLCCHKITQRKRKLRKAEHSYYKEQFERHKNNLSLVWRTIKGILNSNQKLDIIDCIDVNGHKITDKLSIAQKFNEYFTNIGPSLVVKIPAVNCSHMSYWKVILKDSFSLFHTDPLEVESVAKNLSIPVDVAKMSIHCIAPVLC